jgi:8-oxo-dGTP pyrophosphatase MutT (NUDIX family)
MIARAAVQEHSLDYLQNLMRQWRVRGLLAAGRSIVRQAGAIPYTIVNNQVVFLIVTSRGTGRWIFPKGELAEGLEPWETAAMEALEEAGVEGEIERQPIGSYRTTKSLAIRRTIIEVDMYPLRVTRQLEQWQEMKHRHRHWVILPEARRLLSEPRLAELAQRLSRRVLAHPQPAKELISQ